MKYLFLSESILFFFLLFWVITRYRNIGWHFLVVFFFLFPRNLKISSDCLQALLFLLQIQLSFLVLFLFLGKVFFFPSFIEVKMKNKFRVCNMMFWYTINISIISHSYLYVSICLVHLRSALLANVRYIIQDY